MSIYQSTGVAWVNDDPNLTEQQSSIGRLSGGCYVMAWVDGNSGDNNIRAQIFNADGTTIGGQFVVNSPNDPLPTIFPKFNPVISLLDNGNFVIAFDEAGRGTNGYGVVARVFDQTGASVSGPFVALTNFSSARQPQLIAAGGDQFYVLSLSAPDYEGTNIYAQKMNSSGDSLGGPMLISAATLDQSSGVFAFDSVELLNGQFVVSYLRFDDRPIIALRLVDAAMQPIGAEIIVDASALSLVGYGRESIAVTALADGGFVVNWLEDSVTAGGVTDIWVQRFNSAGTAQDGPVLVSTANVGFSGSDVAGLDDGNFVVTWQDIENPLAPPSALGQLFSAAGEKIGIPFNVSSGGAGYSQVTGLDGGGFAVTYMDITSYSSGVVVRSFSYGNQPATSGADVIALSQDHVGEVQGLAGDDMINGNALNNILRGDAGDDQLYGGKGNDLLDGGADNDTATYSDSTAAVKVNLSLTSAQKTGGGGTDTLISIENLIGSKFNDTLTGNSAVNRIVGGAGNDKIDGKGGTDILEGGAGNDTYTVDDSADIIIEMANGGTDQVNSSVDFSIGNFFFGYGFTDTIENLTLTGANHIFGTGNELANKITGNSGDNVLNGLGGKDVLIGGSGNDQLIGGADSDTLTGGIGNDQFVYTSVLPAKERDTIKDFIVGEDQLVFERANFSAFLNNPIGVLSASEFTRGSKATTVDHHIIYDSAKGALYYDPDGIGGVSQIQIATLSNKALVSESDIFLL